MTSYESIRKSIPPALQEKLDALWIQTGGKNDIVNVCLAGPFSSGKTSLLNILLGQNIFPTALEECTAIPAFVEYGETPTYQIALEDGSIEDTDLETLSRKLANPSKDMTLASVHLPEDWLKGCLIIDLPGTGGNDKKRAALSTEQMRRSDAVVYLLASRGPSTEDAEHIAYLNGLGKSVLVGVSKWDVVEDAVARGEQRPNLQKWGEELRTSTGLDTDIIPLSIQGHGIDAIKSFVRKAVQQTEDIRFKMFIAEAIPILKGRLTFCESAIASLGAETEDAIREQHRALIERRQQLLDIRSKAYSRQECEQKELSGAWDSGCSDIAAGLEESLLDAAERLTDTEGQEAFTARGTSELQGALDRAAVLARQLSERYGNLQIPATELAAVQIHIPSIAPVAVEDFLDKARLDALESRLEFLSKQQEQEGQKTEQDTSIDEAEKGIADLEQRRYDLLTQKLPMISETTPPGSMWRTIGRGVGEVADIFLLAPALLACAAGFAGKIGKGACVAAKSLGASAKAANTVKTTVGASIGKRLAMLDRLSLGYWGEALGASLDGDPVVRTYTDPQALQARNAELIRIEEEIAKKRKLIFDVEEASHPRIDTAKIRDEINQLTAKREKLLADAQTLMHAESDNRRKEFFKILAYEKQKCCRFWCNSFDKQCASMYRLLDKMFKNWWEEYLPSLLDEQNKAVKELEEGLHALPEKRQEHEKELRQEIQEIESIIRNISE